MSCTCRAYNLLYSCGCKRSDPTRYPHICGRTRNSLQHQCLCPEAQEILHFSNSHCAYHPYPAFSKPLPTRVIEQARTLILPRTAPQKKQPIHSPVIEQARPQILLRTAPQNKPITHFPVIGQAGPQLTPLPTPQNERSIQLVQQARPQVLPLFRPQNEQSTHSSAEQQARPQVTPLIRPQNGQTHSPTVLETGLSRAASSIRLPIRPQARRQPIPHTSLQAIVSAVPDFRPRATPPAAPQSQPSRFLGRIWTCCNCGDDYRAGSYCITCHHLCCKSCAQGRLPNIDTERGSKRPRCFP